MTCSNLCLSFSQKHEIQTWYYSAFPESYSNLSTLYVCEYCLTYMKKDVTYKRYHVEGCRTTCPPGRRIYLEGDLAVYEIDGRDHKAFCQKLCLLAKLFLDHKTLYFDVTPFLFYVVCTIDHHGSKMVGYFSKEKVSDQGYNLACILTLPQYQHKGYGKFIIRYGGIVPSLVV
jgi:histone acetyltransferase MYST1